jgi:hypothetical protein
LFLSENGEVFACGWGADGQTGLGHFSSEWQPSRVLGDIEGENIVKVSSAADCVLAINGEYSFKLIFAQKHLWILLEFGRCVHISRKKLQWNPHLGFASGTVLFLV